MKPMATTSLNHTAPPRSSEWTLLLPIRHIHKDLEMVTPDTQLSRKVALFSQSPLNETPLNGTCRPARVHRYPSSIVWQFLIA